MIVVPFVVAILILFVNQTVKAAEQTSHTTIHNLHQNATTVHQHTHHLSHPAHQALTSQAHQYGQSVHSVVNAVQTQASTINLASHQSTFYAQTDVNAITGRMAQASNNQILSNASFLPQQHHTSHLDGSLASAVAQHSNLHHVAQLNHASLVGNATQPSFSHSHHNQAQTLQHVAENSGTNLHSHSTKTEMHSANDDKTKANQAKVEHTQEQTLSVNHNYVPQVGSISSSLVPHTFKEGQIQISKVIKGDFAAWTGNKDKPLTLQDVGALLRNPHVTGTQAAALGVIAQKMNLEYVSKHDKNISFTYSQLTSLLHEGWQVANNKAQHNAGSSFTTNFINATAQIASARTENGQLSLYGSVGRPDSADIKQGAVNDCYFLSSVETLLNKDPKIISDMISDNKNGTYTVKFGNGQTETVKLTDGAIAEFSLAKHDGAWLAVLGIAEAQVREGNNSVKNATPLGNTIDLGSQSQAMTLLTGVQYHGIKSSGTDWNVSAMTQVLDSAFATKQPVGVSSKDHALAILGWDPKTQEVTIKNPWGTSGKYSPEGNPNQFMMEKNGVFKISLSEMLQLFRNVSAPESIIAQLQGNQNSAPISNHSSPVVAGSNMRAPLASSYLNLNVGTIPHNSNQRSHFSHAMQLGSNTLKATSLSEKLSSLPRLSTITQALASTNVDISEVDLQTLTQTSKHLLQPKDKLQSLLLEPEDKHHYTLNEGTFFLCSQHKSTIHNHRATVHVQPNTAVFIVNLGSELGIYNLHDSKTGSVKIEIAGEQPSIERIHEQGNRNAQAALVHDVPVGHAIILADPQMSKPEYLLLPKYIGMGDLQLSKTEAPQKLFTGLFSYASAILNCPQLTELRRSHSSSNQELSSRLMKTAAAVTTITLSKLNK
ncbi:MAG: hypothetical protein K2X77_15620 [Candidatus Obscuribacterales bacterium]|jgi:hypothetical protein|nr:hypothetical protein [Candidatus Obscuribacterales bacterium]